MSIRTQRIASVIKRDLGEIILRRFSSNVIITITNVQVSPDLSHTKIYVSVFAPGSDEAAIFESLVAQIPAIRGELGSLMRHQVRKIPEIMFYQDDTSEYVNRMEKVFRDIKKNDSESNK